VAAPRREWWEEELRLLAPIMQRHLREGYMAAAESAARQLPAIARYQIDWALVNEAAWRRSREYGYELVKGICATSEAFLREAISEWIDTGRPLDELAGELARGGMFGPARSQMIAVTEVTRAYAEGNRLAWQASGVVDRVRWQTAMDERVCPQCGPMHNTTDVVGGDFEGMGPPRHPGCRCWLIPVVDPYGAP
jgi:SPP1 gp7 family putative phage head morphogenesis protein